MSQMAGNSSVIGVYGMGVMGQSLALNIASKGMKVSVTNRSSSPKRVHETVLRAEKEGILKGNVSPHVEAASFVKSLAQPRSIIILVPAGKAVDDVIDELLPHLASQDLLIDGGNEWYEMSIRRASQLESKGIRFIGMGISGGEEGARNGPCMMVGGSKEAYALVSTTLDKIAARVDGEACLALMGPVGSGNYVKMIHNGIEYAVMAVISEAYLILKHLGGLSNEQLSNVFTEWNKTELASFLVEITAEILKKPDDETLSGFLLDKISDKAGSNGTGKWSVQQVFTLYPCSLISIFDTLHVLNYF